MASVRQGATAGTRDERNGGMSVRDFVARANEHITERRAAHEGAGLLLEIDPWTGRPLFEPAPLAEQDDVPGEDEDKDKDEEEDDLDDRSNERDRSESEATSDDDADPPVRDDES